MAKNAFRKFQGYVDKPKRNVFDLSFQNNLTCKFGELVPVFCKEVIPGDSFRIDPTFGFRMVPLVFPLQTKMSANLHFFYVRNRNLWKDWPDFIGKTKDGLVPPYLSPTSNEEINKVFKTGSLGDYLGLPTTFAGSFGWTDTLKVHMSASNNNTGYYSLTHGGESVAPEYLLGLEPGKMKHCAVVPTPSTYPSSSSHRPAMYGFQVQNPDGSTVDISMLSSARWSATHAPETEKDCYLVFLIHKPYEDGQGERQFAVAFRGTLIKNTEVEGFNILWRNSEVEALRKWVLEAENDLASGFSVETYFMNYVTTADGEYGIDVRHDADVLLSLDSSTVTDVTDMPIVPYHVNRGDQTGKIRINALPFRAYESIYNAFYRNQQNDPLLNADGDPEYNKFILNDEGGEDHTVYEIRKRNWEKDYLTTCVQSPQQGIAPLVGVSSNGTFTFENEEGTQYTAKAVIGEDGHTLTGIQTMDPQLNANGTGRMLVDMISHGISINDFRNVNALQRWLETNIRRGFRYKDQIMSHFGVDPDYAAMDMPEFIGGVSRPVTVNTVVQTVETETDPLGSYGGQANVFGQGKSVSKYCDEHGYIIGILSVVPTPNYSQLLPKHFLKSDPLDYFFPEFGHIGMQPILYNEVAPIQSFYNMRSDTPIDSDLLHKTFGYQRAWYDYLGSVDEVHGLMRTSLRNFVMNRTFNEVPQLGHKFLQIDPKQLNAVFTDTDDTDKIIGVIDFQVSAKRPIPMFGIPRLE